MGFDPLLRGFGKCLLFMLVLSTVAIVLFNRMLPIKYSNM